MSDFKAKKHQNRFQLGLWPRSRWGSLQRSPDPLAGWVPTSKRRGYRKGGQREREEKAGEGKKERGGSPVCIFKFSYMQLTNHPACPRLSLKADWALKLCVRVGVTGGNHVLSGGQAPVREDAARGRKWSEPQRRGESQLYAQLTYQVQTTRPQGESVRACVCGAYGFGLNCSAH